MKPKLSILDNIAIKVIIIIFSFFIPLNICEAVDTGYNDTIIWISGFIGALICCLLDIISSFGDDYMEKNAYEKVIFDCEYFIISEVYLENRKTPILTIYTKDGYNLGTIKWFGNWRKFCFYPNSDTIWDNKCLSELLNFLEQYNKEWRNRNAKNIKKDVS